jgi:hypothetical protein
MSLLLGLLWLLCARGEGYGVGGLFNTYQYTDLARQTLDIDPTSIQTREGRCGAVGIIDQFPFIFMKSICSYVL